MTKPGLKPSKGSSFEHVTTSPPLANSFLPSSVGLSGPERAQRGSAVGRRRRPDVSRLLARVHFYRKGSTRGYVDRPSGRAPPMDSPWTALRPAHRLPTGSTLDPHIHPSNRHQDFKFLMGKEISSGIAPMPIAPAKWTFLRS